MGLHAMWVHGTAFSPPENPSQGLENVDGVPYTDVLGMRRGWGASWQGEAGAAHWFHVSIPTPVTVDGTAARLTRVWVKYSTGSGLFGTSSNPLITDVHVWDGANRLEAFGNLDRWGDRRGSLVPENTFVLAGAPYVGSGVGISVRVLFQTIGERLIEFSAAGAEFEVAPLVVRIIPFLQSFKTSFRGASG